MLNKRLNDKCRIGRRTRGEFLSSSFLNCKTCFQKDTLSINIVLHVLLTYTNILLLNNIYLHLNKKIGTAKELVPRIKNRILE